MTNFNEYFFYLRKRSRMGHLYRRLFLYPVLNRYLKGHTLDIGCGIGDFISYRSSTTGIDINPNTVAYCKARGLDAHIMTPDQIPFPNGRFDSALLDNVLEHLNDPYELLGEVKRALKPDGVVVIGVPGKKGWSADSDHKVFYDEKTLHSCMKDAGFIFDKVFYMPIGKSSYLNEHLRQYCMYGVFFAA